ncbi:MAG: DUF2017 family protein [Acidimicrobiia bacterium]
MRVRRLPDRVEISLDGAEAMLLGGTAEQLRPLLTGETQGTDYDPVRERLFPRAYSDPTEDDAEDEWQLAVHGDLVRERVEALDALTKALTGAGKRRSQRIVRLSLEDTERWLTALNDARLALGTRLGITEDLTFDAVPEEERGAYEVYGWLTFLQGELVEALSLSDD